MPGNLPVQGDELTGVIDVGQLGVADPALDLPRASVSGWPLSR